MQGGRTPRQPVALPRTSPNGPSRKGGPRVWGLLPTSTCPGIEELRPSRRPPKAERFGLLSLNLALLGEWPPGPGGDKSVRIKARKKPGFRKERTGEDKVTFLLTYYGPGPLFIIGLVLRHRQETSGW